MSGTARISKLESVIEEKLASGSFLIGEVIVRRNPGGGFLLHHVETDPATAVRRETDPARARFLARNDEAGVYRPLKSAPTLARGWVLELTTIADVHRALDFLYPAAIGLWLAHEEGQLRPVPFSETAARQTGMYRIVGLATPEQVEETAAEACSSAKGCLRTLLWEVAPGRKPAVFPATKFDPAIDQRTGVAAQEAFVPILCAEGCNLLVAACRTTVKKSRPTPPAAT